jgi:hypothetical protein
MRIRETHITAGQEVQVSIRAISPDWRHSDLVLELHELDWNVKVSLSLSQGLARIIANGLIDAIERQQDQGHQPAH